MDPVIRIEDVSKVFPRGLRHGSVLAVDGVTMEIDRGDTFGLLGPNGAGKTTLLKLLLGIVRPSRGMLALFGRPPRDPLSRVRVGYLPEAHRFPPSLTARQVLDIYGRLGGLERQFAARQASELLERVDLEHWADVRVGRFSKGMMQRLGLAQALLGDPDLVVLDEPTDGVDPGGRRLIRDLIVWLRDRGRTVFLNSHILSEVEQVCTRVAIMHRGAIVRLGSVDELTRASASWTLVCPPVPGELAGSLDLEPASRTAPPGLRAYRLAAPDRSALAAVLATLLDAGVEVEGVYPERKTLEESFLDLVEARDDA